MQKAKKWLALLCSIAIGCCGMSACTDEPQKVVYETVLSSGDAYYKTADNKLHYYNHGRNGEFDMSPANGKGTLLKTTKDRRYMFFYSQKNNSTLSRFNTSENTLTAETQIGTQITSMALSEDGENVLYLTQSGKLYSYTADGNKEIGSDVKGFFYNTDCNKVVYQTNNDIIYAHNGTQESKIDTNAQLLFCSSDLSMVYYGKGYGDIYLKKGEGKSENIFSDMAYADRPNEPSEKTDDFMLPETPLKTLKNVIFTPEGKMIYRTPNKPAVNLLTAVQNRNILPPSAWTQLKDKKLDCDELFQLNIYDGINTVTISNDVYSIKYQDDVLLYQMYNQESVNSVEVNVGEFITNGSDTECKNLSKAVLENTSPNLYMFSNRLPLKISDNVKSLENIYISENKQSICFCKQTKDEGTVLYKANILSDNVKAEKIADNINAYQVDSNGRCMVEKNYIPQEESYGEYWYDEYTGEYYYVENTDEENEKEDEEEPEKYEFYLNEEKIANDIDWKSIVSVDKGFFYRKKDVLYHYEDDKPKEIAQNCKSCTLSEGDEVLILCTKKGDKKAKTGTLSVYADGSMKKIADNVSTVWNVSEIYGTYSKKLI